jgi:hypothetical protein
MISKTIHQIFVISTLLFLCLFHRGNHVVLSFSISSPQHGLLLLSSTTRLESGMIISSSLHRRGNSLSYHMNTENDDGDHYNRNLNTNEIDDDEIDDEEEQKTTIPFLDKATTRTISLDCDNWTVPPPPQEQHSVSDDTVKLDLMMTTTTTEKIVDDADHVGAIGLSIWMTSLCAFVFVNNFIGPWPQSIYNTVPERIWFLGHVIGGMLFGGGVIVTTCVEWLVGRSKNLEVMTFWFQNVPLLDTSIVLPGLTLSILSGTGLTTIRYGGLSYAPQHIIYAFWTLLVYAAWWGFTDLTTQGRALEAVTTISNNNSNKNNDKDTTDVGKPLVLKEVPEVVNERMLINVICCVLVFVLYAIKVLKPGTLCLL